MAVADPGIPATESVAIPDMTIAHHRPVTEDRLVGILRRILRSHRASAPVEGR